LLKGGRFNGESTILKKQTYSLMGGTGGGAGGTANTVLAGDMGGPGSGASHCERWFFIKGGGTRIRGGNPPPKGGGGELLFDAFGARWRAGGTGETTRFAPQPVVLFYARGENLGLRGVVFGPRWCGRGSVGGAQTLLQKKKTGVASGQSGGKGGFDPAVSFVPHPPPGGPRGAWGPT